MTRATVLKLSAMIVSIPRYVGILFYASGFALFSTWSVFHYAELFAGTALALLEGFAISYMVDRVQLNTSKVEQGLIVIVAGLLLILLPLAAVPSMYFAYSGASLFNTPAEAIAKTAFTCVWLFAVASMPILIIIGVGLTQSDPLDRQLKKKLKEAKTKQRIAELEAQTEQRIAERKAEVEQAIAQTKAQTKQVLLQYQLEDKQTRAEYKQRSGKIQQEVEQTQATRLPFPCSCGKSFPSKKALAGHHAHCKVRANGHPDPEPIEATH